jgi:hypothetical protein
MTSSARIWVDFMKTDDARRLVLTTLGTLNDLKKNNLELHEGMTLNVYSDDADDAGNRNDLFVDGVVKYDPEMKRWVLEIDWNAISHESDRLARD